MLHIPHYLSCALVEIGIGVEIGYSSDGSCVPRSRGTDKFDGMTRQYRLDRPLPDCNAIVIAGGDVGDVPCTDADLSGFL